MAERQPELAAVGDKVTDKDYFGTGLGTQYVRATLNCSRNSTLRWKKEERWHLRNHLQQMVPEVIPENEFFPLASAAGMTVGLAVCD